MKDNRWHQHTVPSRIHAVLRDKCNYRSLSPVPRKPFLEEKEVTTLDAPLDKSRSFHGASNLFPKVRRQIARSRSKPHHLVPPFRRMKTTYVDTWRKDARLAGPLNRPLPMAWHSASTLKRFSNVRSRVMDHHRSVPTQNNEKIVLRTTKLCYARKKYVKHRCDHHFNLASMIRKMDTEHRRLMWMQRLKEIGDHRPSGQYTHGLDLRRATRKEATIAIEDAIKFLQDLNNNFPEALDREREMAYWQLEVAHRRIDIADATDKIDVELGMVGEAQHGMEIEITDFTAGKLITHQSGVRG